MTFTLPILITHFSRYNHCAKFAQTVLVSRCSGDVCSIVGRKFRVMCIIMAAQNCDKAPLSLRYHSILITPILVVI
jgi:hypothetical protein